jgi:3-oxoacyl-[acyl-carrier protein] reductase
MKRFDDNVVLVTGAGRGMGRTIAERFAAEGAHVVVSARTESRGKETVRRIVDAGGNAVLSIGDIADRDAIRGMVNTASRSYGRLDIVVHCAAESSHGKVVDMSEDTFDKLVRSNVHSLFWLARDAHPLLSKAPSKGRLIYISSGSANRNYIPGLIPYMATKAFMNAFARGLAMEMGHDNILVNVIEPGMVASDRMKERLSSEVALKIARPFPVPRPGLTDEIADAVLFMASAHANYITGANLLVDGGASMAPLGSLENELN